MDTEGFKYCPICGHSLIHLNEKKDNGPRCVKCERIFYSAPHPTVSAIITDAEEKQFILARRKFAPLKGYWDIPGGFLGLGESLEDGLRRELREELEIEIQIKELLGSYADVYGENLVPTINVFYLATIFKGIPTARSDVSEVRWFQQNEIPSSVAFECVRWAINTWLEVSFSKRD
jgi:ADP-ribose pyrophosphatase YjhB (NUDIX family)